MPYNKSKEESYKEYELSDIPQEEINQVNSSSTYLTAESSINTNEPSYGVITETMSTNTTNSYISPVKGKVIKEFAANKLVYSKTLDMWKTHPGIDIKAELGEMVASVCNGKVVSIENDSFYGKTIKIYAEKDAANLPWGELNIDEVFECTGRFTEKEKADAHIKAGAKKVIISAPAKGDLKTIVYNVNEDTLDGTETVISAASCTTNCLAPVLNIIEKNIGITKGFMTTVHAYTNDQATLDVAHKKGIKARRGRACAANIVPASTGAASAIGLVCPNLKGKLEGVAMRVPVSTGSVVDLVLELANVSI